ncbi:MAG: cation diffusion facilitator family transporter [Rhizomicrobium sp.]
MSGIAQSGRLMRRAALASVSVSLLLVAIKTFAYFTSHSVAMLASLADSALDLFTSALNLFAIREALAPPDREHRFGHGKAEPLAGLAQGAFIAASALFLVIQAVQRVINPQPVEHGLAALIVMLISIAMTVGLILYEREVIKRTGSIAVSADQTHYIGDLATNIGVVIAILLSTGLGWLKADPIIALLVAAVMVASAWLVFRQSLDQLMDRELPDAEREKIKAIVRAHPEVLSLHDLKTRMAGLHTFIQIHIELDPQMPLAKAHAVSDAVEQELCAAFDRAEVIIHQDPAGLEQVQE